VSRDSAQASLLTRTAAALAGVILCSAAAAAGASALAGGAGWVLLAGLVAGGAAAAALLRWALGSVRGPLLALRDGVRSFRDGDFSMRLRVDGPDELGELLRLYNQIADALGSERREIYQRELLLDALLQSAPMAAVLTAGGDRVVYGNRLARDLLGLGRRLEGRRLGEILAGGPPELAEALAASDDALFTVRAETGDETYRAARRTFQISAQAHTLYTLERLTPELRRHEVQAWKHAIRVINHELNNSFAPIRSLVHSAGQVMARPEHAHRLGEIFATISERVTHLTTFLQGYAAFARIPQPARAAVPWVEFLEGVRRLVPFRIEAPLPERPGHFDPTLVQQVLINLVKNAREAGSAEEDVVVSVQLAADGGAVLRVADRGRGMDEEVVRRSLVPFYTSKPGGTGLGLPLSNEIIEAHGGRLQLENRAEGGLLVTCRLPGPGLTRSS
jgi:two-component system, NtrC family, nitrogen regulation sensor histidine kinase NtrY